MATGSTMDANPPDEFRALARRLRPFLRRRGETLDVGRGRCPEMTIRDSRGAVLRKPVPATVENLRKAVDDYERLHRPMPVGSHVLTKKDERHGRIVGHLPHPNGGRRWPLYEVRFHDGGHAVLKSGEVWPSHEHIVRVDRFTSAMGKWARENTKGRWSILTCGRGAVLGFTDPESAAMFRLFWL